MDIIEAASDEIVTIPYTLFDERIGDTDEWTQVLILGSFQAPLARFVPLQEDMTLGEWGEPIKQIESPLDDREDTTPDYLDTPLTDSPFDGDNWQDAIVHQNHDATELAGSNWIATKIRGTHTSPNHEVLLFFASDTRLEGHGGCNGFDASWDMLSGIDFLQLQQFSVEEFVSTFRFRKGVIGQTEMDFFNGLQQGPVVYDIDVDELTLWDTVIGEDGRQARGNILAKFTNAHVPNFGEVIVWLAWRARKPRL